MDSMGELMVFCSLLIDEIRLRASPPTFLLINPLTSLFTNS